MSTPRPPAVTIPGGWAAASGPEGARALGGVLLDVVGGQRWFAGKARPLLGAEVRGAVPVPLDDGRTALVVLADIRYADGPPDTYVLPLVPAARGDGEPVLVVVDAATRTTTEVADAMHDEVFARRLLALVGAGERLEAGPAVLEGTATSAYARLVAGAGDLAPSLSRREQSNSSVRYGDRLILKLFRRAPEGDNPEWEMGRYLTTVAGFEHAPAVAGALELVGADGARRTLAVVHALVPHEADAWGHAAARVDAFLDAVAPLVADGAAALPVPEPLAGLTGLEPPADVAALLGATLEEAALLGRRTGEMHLALCGPPGSGFEPVPLTPDDLGALSGAVSAQVRGALALLDGALEGLHGAAVNDAAAVLAGAGGLLAASDGLAARPMDGVRVRCHGDYHLGQVLWTGSDFVIIDFEGEPLRPFAERRVPQPPLRDVAGMLRSYEYAAHAGLARRGVLGGADGGWARAGECWASWAGAAFLSGYAATAGSLLPQGEGAAAALLRALLLEKTAYELVYELNQRPDWASIPLHGLAALLP